MKIIKRSFLLLALFSSAASGQISFQKNFGADSTGDYGQSVIEAPNGGYYIAGTRVSGSAIPYIGEGVLKRVDPQGNEVWTKYYSTPGSDDLNFDCVERTSDNNLIITGTANYGQGEYDAYLMKADTSGNVLWYKNFGGKNRQRTFQVKETSDKGFIMGGWNEINGGAISSFYLIRTDSAGDTLWTKSYPNNQQQYGYAVDQTPDGGFVIAGSVLPPLQFGTSAYVIKTDINGDMIWAKTISTLGFSAAYDVKNANNGNIVITGYATLNGCSQPFLAELDQNGIMIWSEIQTDGPCGWSYSVCRTADNGYAIFGMDDVSDYYLIKTDSSGNKQWFKKFHETDTDYGYSVKQTSDKGFIMSGLTVSGQSSNIILIKTDSLGNIITGINEAPEPVSFRVYPNPARDLISIEIPSGFQDDKLTLTLFNSAGQQVLTRELCNNPLASVSLNTFPSGIYYISIAGSNGKLAGNTIVIE